MVKKALWKPPTMGAGLFVAGGYLKKPMPVDVKEIMGRNGVKEDFVKVDKQTDWLCRAITGKDNNKRGALKRTSIIQEMRFMACQSHETDISSVLDAVAADTKDPMLMCDDITDSTPVKKNKFKKKTLEYKIT